MASRPSTLPRWADEADPSDLVEPSEARKDAGWPVGFRPPSQIFNWLQNNVYQWLDHVSDYSDQLKSAAGIVTYAGAEIAADMVARTLTWANLQTFSKGIVANQSTTNGHGAMSYGNGTGAGAVATGGGSAGTGVIGQGGANGAGGDFYAGAGNNLGVAGTGTGTGHGVVGTAGATGRGGYFTATVGEGVRGVGGGANEGVRGLGGSTGPGGSFTAGTGGTAAGVIGVGGSTGAGGYGGDFTGGGSNAAGVNAVGGGTGAGGLFTGGGSGGPGLIATATGNRIGAEVVGSGSEVGLKVTAGSTAAQIRIVPRTTYPGTLQNGDMFLIMTGNRSGGTARLVIWYDGAEWLIKQDVFIG